MKSDKSLFTIIVGLVLIALGVLTQQVMPVLGRVAFQAAAAGSYRPEDYHVNLAGYYSIAGIIITLALIDLYTSWRKKSDAAGLSNQQ